MKHSISFLALLTLSMTAFASDDDHRTATAKPKLDVMSPLKTFNVEVGREINGKNEIVFTARPNNFSDSRFSIELDEANTKLSQFWNTTISLSSYAEHHPKIQICFKAASTFFEIDKTKKQPVSPIKSYQGCNSLPMKTLSTKILTVAGIIYTVNITEKQ